MDVVGNVMGLKETQYHLKLTAHPDWLRLDCLGQRQRRTSQSKSLSRRDQPPCFLRTCVINLLETMLQSRFPLPVQVPIDPDSDYTVSALIKAATGPTFQGVKGQEDVEGYSRGGNMFNVCFVDIDDESATDVEVGQIPILVFKV